MSGGTARAPGLAANGTVVLEGVLVRLEPLSTSHAPDLSVAAEEDRSAYDWSTVPRGCEVEAYIADQLARPGFTPFALIRRSDGRAVGCTALLEPKTWPGRDDLCAVEIGATWLSASAQRSGINAGAKLVLFAYAFEVLRVVRVELKTDARNDRSRRAIAALGARFEGVLRSWTPSRAVGEEGLLRDSAMFSVVAAEWPEVKAGLVARLAAPAGRSADGS